MPDLNEVLREALSLDVQDRASLAEKLLASLGELAGLPPPLYPSRGLPSAVSHRWLASQKECP